ncbi:MAG: 2OG-Fe(II) oxygenase [Rhodospirillales bacterium]|nr:2OG-Fe(II) oxygenase [Rhodospirillales bacterium]
MTNPIAESFLRCLKSSQTSSAPYRHWLLRNALPAASASAIAGLPFPPPSGLVFNGKRETNNSTRLHFSPENQDRHAVMRDMAAAFQSPDVSTTIGEICGIDLTGTYLRIEYCQDTNGFWLEPHTDIGVKKYTMLVYLSKEPGCEDWGTDIYDQDRILVKTAPYEFNCGLVFIPGTNTWHGVAPRTIGGIRKSVIVNYVTDEWRARHELCFPQTPIA